MRKHGKYYACDTCPELHTTAIGATLCCPPIQDADDDNPDIIRSID